MKILLYTFVLVVIFCSPASSRELYGTLAQIKSTGIIKIGYRPALPPMSFVDGKGEVRGYSIDLCHKISDAVGKNLGIKVKKEYVEVDAVNRFMALRDGKIDILCGASTETLSRRELVDFTKSIYVTGGSYLHKREVELKNNFQGKKLGVVSNTTTETALEELFIDMDMDVEIVQFNSTADAFTALFEDEIDGFSADQIVLIGLMAAGANMGEFRVLPDLFSYEPIALAVRKNDAAFRLVADRVLVDLFRSNEIETIYDNWFSKKLSGSQPSALRTIFKLNALSN